MSVCTFIAADHSLPLVCPPQDFPLEINVDTGVIYDGGADENFRLLSFPDVSVYTNKCYGVQLEWQYTPGRAHRIISYIQDALQHTDVVELWHIWLLGWWEWEDRPVVHSRTIPISSLTAEDIKALDDAPIWDIPDKHNPERPSFRRIIITR